MKERYFLKHLATFLIPLIFPLALLGALSFGTTQHDLKVDIDRNSQFLLTQSQQQLEMILDELDTIQLALYQNAKVFNDLSKILNNSAFTYETANSYAIINSYLTALVSSKPYIHSIYFYADNPNQRFISSLNGLSSMDRFNDTSWYEQFVQYTGPPKKWTTTRNIKMYNLEDNWTPVISIFNVISPQKIGIILNVAPDYINNLLKNITTHHGQILLILNEDNHVLFSNQPNTNVPNDVLRSITQQYSKSFDLNSNIGNMNVTMLESKSNHWKYISVIPHSSLYETPDRIMKYTIVFMAISFLIGLALTYYLTRRNYRQLQIITKLLRSAENNRLPFSYPIKVNDEYSFIIQNMIAHFIEHRYIQTQLSEQKYRLQVMELLALQSQINPHFLYNTLNSIYWETVGLTGAPNKASMMIENLSDMLSYSLSSPTNEVTWEEEILNTKSYIKLQKIRYNNLFDVIFEYDEEIVPVKTMKLLLQPLVENSLYHGIREKNKSGFIKIKICVRESNIIVTVIDNGQGMLSHQLNRIRTSLQDSDHDDLSKHIGLINTNKRLRLMYKHNYYIAIRSKLHFGTVIRITLPLVDPS